MSFFDDVLEEGKKALGLQKSPSQNTGITPATPWSAFNNEEVFFRRKDIKGENWNKFFPYRLMVIDVNESSKGGYKPVSTGLQVRQDITTQTIEGRTTVTVQPMGNTWVYTFPISPSKLTIVNPFAIRTTSTLQGVLEEHNGTKFKTINISGTTGVWPNRPSLNKAAEPSSSIAASLFSSSFSALSNVASSVNRLKNIAGGNHPASTPKAPKPENALLEQTGYYQAQLLEQFLEQYTIAKKDPANKSWRLVFDIPKKNESYIVTPLMYVSDQNKEKPIEWLYNIQLKAWKRIDINSPTGSISPTKIQLNANAYQRILGSINEARRLVGNSMNLVKAVRSDFQKPLNALRQSALLVKDTVGLAASVVDLPKQIIGDYESSIKDSFAILGDAGQELVNLLPGGGFQAMQKTTTDNEGLSDKQVLNGALGNERKNFLKSDPANNVFDNPEESFEFFNAIDTGILNLNQAQQDVIDNEFETVRGFTVEDIKDMKTTILDLALGINNRYGAGDETVARIYGNPTPRSRVIPMTVEENEIVAALFEVIQGLDYLTATKELDKGNTQSSLEYVGGLANDSDIAFELSNSKFLVPVPFKLNIEQISLRYLGDANRWMEIATLNNLKSPYIDEDGFSLNLLSNGDGRQFNINSNENLYIGQKINLFSTTVSVFIRKIQNIEKISDTNFLITVDGVDNLDSLKIAENAQIKAFLPGTVNSQNTIYIPSKEAAPADDETFSVPYLTEDALTGLSKIDWLLTDTGDIATDALGDIRLSNGMTNIIQAIRQKIVTKKNSLLRHPDYGLGVSPGISHADVLASEIFKDITDMIQQDPRFSSVDKLVLDIKGPVLSIKMNISLAGNNGLLPIDFKVAI